MNALTDASDALRTVLHEEARARAGAHPEVERLAAYFGGALDGEARERLRDHLVGCRQCADRLLEMEPLMQPDERCEEGVADLEIEAAWRHLRGRTATDHAEVAGPSRGFRALAAALAVAALALGLWAGRLQQVNRQLRSRLAEVSAPVANLPVLYLNGATRAAETLDRLEVPRAAGSFALFFSLDEARPAVEYGVRLFDAAGGVVVESEGLVTSESGGLRLGLPRDLLSAGEYRLELRARRDGDWEVQREHRLTIDYR